MNNLVKEENQLPQEIFIIVKKETTGFWHDLALIKLSRSSEVRLHLSLSQASITFHYVRKLKILLPLAMVFLQHKLVPSIFDLAETPN